MFEVLFYEKEDGTRPAEEYLLSEDVKLRAKVGTDISRVLYFFIVGKKVILTNGFRKKTEKTPHDVIELAKNYRDDFIKRYGKEGI